MTHIKVVGLVDDPYAQSLEKMLELEFPGSAARGKCAVFEAVVDEVVGTKQHRYGPTPDPESLVAIREVVREAIEADKPIPILIPWGASKQGPFGVDVAELMALKQINCLGERVKAHYPPGIDARIRLEDLTDAEMFRGMRMWSSKTAEYVRIFSALHQAVATSSNIVLESTIMDSEVFRTKSEQGAQVIFAALDLPADRRGQAVRDVIPEWSGALPDSQLDFYRRAYDKFYPEEDREQKDARLATYFGSAISRFLIGGTGADKSWSKYITLSFTGIPWGKSGRRIFYRTIPEKYTNQHRAPWIGKGYVRIRGRAATPAIAGFSGDDLPFVPANLSIAVSPFLEHANPALGHPVVISADYVVVE
jgi:hypothetical protein